jgi:uncharacterized protein YbjT (DUF2867 family)
MKRILVLGGTGRIGRAVVRELLQAGYTVQVLTRDLTKTRHLLPDGVQGLQGDLQDKQRLQQLMKGIEVVYMNFPETIDPNQPFIADIQGVQNVLQTAPKDALLIKLSEIGASEHLDYFNLTFKHRADEMIRASGFRYVILRPTWFMESLPLALTQGKRVMVVGRQPSPVYWIAGQDLGRQVVNAIENQSAHNQIFTVQGLEALTFKQATQTYVQIMGAGLSVLHLPLWVMRFGGIFDKQMLADYQLMAFFNQRTEVFESQYTWEQLGKPTITLEQFAMQWKSEHPQ